VDRPDLRRGRGARGSDDKTLPHIGGPEVSGYCPESIRTLGMSAWWFMIKESVTIEESDGACHLLIILRRR